MAKPTKPPISLLKKWIERCKPDQPLPFKDDRYVLLQGPEGGLEAGVRGVDPMLSYLDVIELSDQPTAQLFSGYIGTGKSTELLRLKHLLEKGGYLVLYADSQDYLDLAHSVGIEELLVILAAAVSDSASKLGKSGGGVPGYWERFTSFLQSEVTLETTIKIPGVADLKANLMHGRPLWQQIRDVLGTSIAKLKDDAHSHIAEVVETLLKKSPLKKGVVLLFDSLERLRDPDEEKLYQTMQATVHVLAQYSTFLHLPCHVIYTVSPYSTLVPSDFTGRYDGRLQTLPSIKIYERGPDAMPSSDGVQAMRSIVENRIPIQEVFGDREYLIERLILASGGHVRSLLVFLSELLAGSRRRGLPVSERDVQRIIDLKREQIVASIRPEAVPLLDSIRRDGSLEDVPAEQLGILALYVDSHTVLCYRNGEGWYEIHPLAREYVTRRAADLSAKNADDQLGAPLSQAP